MDPESVECWQNQSDFVADVAQFNLFTMHVLTPSRSKFGCTAMSCIGHVVLAATTDNHGTNMEINSIVTLPRAWSISATVCLSETHVD